MEIGTNYTKVVSEVSKVNKTSTYKQEEKKVDYSNYSIKDIRNIPYEEAKNNYVQIKEQLKKLGNENSSDELGIEFVAATFQLERVKLSDNNKLNKALYATMSNENNPSKAILFDSELMTNLQDYYHGKSINASFVASNDEIHTSKNLTKSQINSIDFNDFISKMISTFTEDLNESKGSVKDQYSNIVNFYNSLQDNYNKTVREPYYA